MKEEEGRCIAALEAFNVADKRINKLKNKLTEAKREKKSVEATLEGAERQVEGPRRQLHQTEDQLATAKEQIAVLKKKLEEAEKAKDQAKQDGYDVGVAETKETLRAEVSEDPLKENEVPPRMEIVLATLPVPAIGGLNNKDQGSSEAALSQSTKTPPKDKIVIKKK
ncbi:uncharacterized protein LOC126704967 [Quercus robur]|uniref:uncharacterized protein LOC126704967 n=1 Tax=Quercus robur TaxID=38942 RepID=UPI0021627106|nr:uncharacterized protein LOC126704967 [Quercus robur]